MRKKKTTDYKKIAPQHNELDKRKTLTKIIRHKIPLQLRCMPKNAISGHKQVKKLLLTSSFLLIKSEKYIN